GGRPFTIEVVVGLDAAVAAAARQAGPGDVVLLSPGGTSFDEFPDFAARGDRFQELIQRL
ncbi:MAG: UDP-N-acetylmuramoyl-L-alanine--D-glutamate ligase, partial [Anaerolineales bacterium]